MALEALQRLSRHVRNRLPRRALIAALLIVSALGAGVGGYLIGSSPEVDLEASRVAAAEDGREAGARAGEREGYARGFESARERPYRAVYAAAYREAYADEFESAGLEPPEAIRVIGRP